jgi:hypothetical protein
MSPHQEEDRSCGRRRRHARDDFGDILDRFYEMGLPDDDVAFGGNWKLNMLSPSGRTTTETE